MFLKFFNFHWKLHTLKQTIILSHGSFKRSRPSLSPKYIHPTSWLFKGWWPDRRTNTWSAVRPGHHHQVPNMSRHVPRTGHRVSATSAWSPEQQRPTQQHWDCWDTRPQYNRELLYTPPRVRCRGLKCMFSGFHSDCLGKMTWQPAQQRTFLFINVVVLCWCWPLAHGTLTFTVCCLLDSQDPKLRKTFKLKLKFYHDKQK